MPLEVSDIRQEERVRSGVRGIACLLWGEATPFVRCRLLGALGLVIGGSVLTALSPVALRFVVDALVTHERGGGSRAALPLVALYVTALWLARMANELRELVFARARQRMFRTLSEKLFSHLMHLPLRFHLNRQTGAVSQTLDSGLEGLRMVLHHLVFGFLPVAVELVTIFLVLQRFVKPGFLALFFGAVLCYATAFGCSATAVRQLARSASAARISATAEMTDALLNYETVKYFTAEAAVQDRVVRALARSESEWVAFYRRYAVNGVLVAGVFAAVLGSAAFYATERVQRGQMSLGDFVLVNMYMLQVVSPLEVIGYAIQGLSQGVAMLERLVRLFGEPAEPGMEGDEKRALGPGCLEFQDVCLSYGIERQILSKVTFKVSAGHMLGIVGPSGAGKSTIVRLLMRLLEPESGLILLDDEPIANMSLRELRRSIAVVPQDTVLFDETVRYNIAFGRTDANAREIEDAARVAQLHEFVVSLPDGYETMVGERGVKVSGGERQRISIARAVLKDPRIYVFDEATSSLDSRTEVEILRSLRAICRLNTTLVIAHRLSTVVHADEILVLEDGRVMESGTHDALLLRKGRYAALWAAQQGSVVAA
jgi:ABC-type transport system involved in Fe-S cluster assembly fused permease/ATPase subunit